MNNDGETLVYYMLEANYIKMFGRNITSNINDNSDLFPFGWYNSKRFGSKIKILSEAIEKNIKIAETNLYQEIIEGIKK